MNLASTGTNVSAPCRNEALDVVRGLGIVLVVFGHSWRGVETAGILPDGPVFQSVDRAIYLFHMPLFFLLSGLFFERLLQKTPAAFLTSRAIRLLYPLCIWTWLMGLAKIAAGGAANSPLRLADFPLIPLPPQWQFWFLWGLFGIQLLCYAAGRLSTRTLWWGLLIPAPVLLLAFGLLKTGLPHWTYLFALWNMPFFVAGILLARFDFGQRLPAPAAALAFAACVALAVSFDLSHLSTQIPLSLIAATGFFIATMGWARRGAFGPLTRPLIVLGLASMPIYLAHTFFSAPLRILLLKLGMTDPVSHMALGTIAGLLLPLLLNTVARKLNLSKLLGF